MGGNQAGRDRHAGHDPQQHPQPGDLRFEAQVRVVARGRTVTAAGDRIAVKDADELLAPIAAGTDCALDYALRYKGGDPHAAVTRTLAAAARPIRHRRPRPSAGSRNSP
jgi:hypothetical protein